MGNQNFPLPLEGEGRVGLENIVLHSLQAYSAWLFPVEPSLGELQNSAGMEDFKREQDELKWLLGN
jgi:hypothetical protein